MDCSSPISNLPPESLRAIFSHFVHIPAICKSMSTPDLDNRTVLILSSTCRLWRDIVLDFPELWAHLDDRNTGRFNLFLRRARNAPLHLFLNRPRVTHPGRIVNRTQTLRIEDPTQAVSLLRERVGSLDTVVSSQAHIGTLNFKLPTLECVVMDLCIIPRSPPRLFGEASSVRALSLRAMGCIILRHTAFRNLAHLHVQPTLVATEPTTSEILRSLLKDLPKLHTLRVSRCLDCAPADRLLLRAALSSPDTTLTPVHLPLLRSIVIVSWNLRVALQLVSALDISPDSKVRLHNCVVAEEHIGSAIDLSHLAFLHDVRHVDVAVGDYNLHLVARSERGGLWIAARIPQVERGGFGILPPPRNTDTRWRPWIYETLIRANISLHTVTSCHMHIEHWGAAEERARLLQPMVALRTLDLSGLSAAALSSDIALLQCDSETRPSSAHTNAGEAALSHPNLEEITVELPDGKCGVLTHSFAPWAARRAALGRPLHRLVVALHPDAVQPPPGEFREALIALTPHVQSIGVRRGAVYAPSEFEVHWMWRAAEEHGYWETPEEERPRVDEGWMTRFEKPRAVVQREFEQFASMFGTVGRR